MAVLSVDLAYRRWSDVGIVVLDRVHSPNRSRIGGEIILSAAAGLDNGLDSNVAAGPADANILAGRLNHICGVRDICVIVLDGPQASKSGHNGFEHTRVSERQLNTSAKTGLTGMVKPITYRPFAEFCLDVYDALCRRGWRRLDTQHQTASPQSRILVEIYPHAAWKSLGLKPLPSKHRTRVSDLAEAYCALNALIPTTTDRAPNHDQLQAIVGGLTGLAIKERSTAAARIAGHPPRREDGHWREGFIVLPLPPPRPVNLRWLQ